MWAAEHGNSGIIEHDVDAAVMGDRLLREIEDRVGIAHIADDRQQIGARRAQARRLAIEIRLLDVGHHDLHALADEPFGHAQTDPARRPRHDRDPTLEILHRSLLALF